MPNPHKALLMVFSFMLLSLNPAFAVIQNNGADDMTYTAMPDAQAGNTMPTDNPIGPPVWQDDVTVRTPIVAPAPELSLQTVPETAHLPAAEIAITPNYGEATPNPAPVSSTVLPALHLTPNPQADKTYTDTDAQNFMNALEAYIAAHPGSSIADSSAAMETPIDAPVIISAKPDNFK